MNAKHTSLREQERFNKVLLDLSKNDALQTGGIKSVDLLADRLLNFMDLRKYIRRIFLSDLLYQCRVPATTHCQRKSLE